MGQGELVLMGPPGSGKGTQAKLIAARPGMLHLSTGDLFRKHFREGTALGKLADTYMSKGEYVPDDITVGMVRDRMRELDRDEHVVFDGFPRTVAQAEALDRLLAEIDRRVSHVLLIEVTREELVDRIAKRGEGRADDSPDVVRKRFDVYEERTRPVIDHYDRKGLVRRIHGVGTIDEVQGRIAAVLA